MIEALTLLAITAGFALIGYLGTLAFLMRDKPPPPGPHEHTPPPFVPVPPYQSKVKMP